MNPTPIAAPGVSVEEILAELMAMHDEATISIQEWNKTDQPTALSSSEAKSELRSNKQKARSRFESALRTALLASAAGVPEALRLAVDKVLSEFGTSSDGLYDLYQARKEYETAQPPAPVGAPQGVTDRAVGDALQAWYAMRGYSDLERMRAALENFAANTLAATPAGAVPNPIAESATWNAYIEDANTRADADPAGIKSMGRDMWFSWDAWVARAALPLSGGVQVDAARPASMSLETMIAVNALRNVLAARPTAGNYELCYLDTPLPEVGAYVQKCVDVSGGDKFHFIKALRADGVQIDVAHYGNGPTSNVNGAWACVASPDNIRKVLDALDAAIASQQDGGSGG